MKDRHKFSLIKADFRLLKDLGRFYLIKMGLFAFVLQELGASVLSPSDWGVGKQVIAGLLLTILIFVYLLIFYYIRKLLSSNPLSQMFFQSVFLNIGIFIHFFSIPYVISAYIKGTELFNYYLYGLAVMFFLAFLYVIQLDCKQLIDNSLKYKKSGLTICFAPHSVFWPLSKLQLFIYTPYIVGISFMFYGFSLRSGAKAEYFMTSGMIIFSVLLLYTEFCYFWVWVKYRLIKISDKK